MRTKMQKYWSLFWLFRELALMRMMEYRTDFFFWTAVSLMWTVFNFFFYGMLVQLTGQIGGWTLWEMYILISMFAILDSLTWSLMAQNMWYYTDNIYSGEMSSQLTKPIDFQFLYMTQKNSYNNIPRIIIGVCGVVFSLYKLRIVPTAWQIVLACIGLTSSFLFVYFAWFSISTLAFWVERLNNINEIIPELRSFWQLPRSIYTGSISVLLTFVIPLALLTSVPSEVLLGKKADIFVGYLVLASIIMFIISRVILRISIKKYSSVGG